MNGTIVPDAGYLVSTGHDSKCRSERDDGFVRVTFKTEKGEQQ